MFYKILTSEEINHLKELKDNISNQAEYERLVEEYLEEIHYEDRLEDYLKDKWYIKLIRWFTNKRHSA